MLPSLAFASWGGAGGGGGDARALLAAASITIGAGAALWFGFKGHRGGLGKREGFLVAASGWAVASLFGCLPFLISGAIPSFTDAYFETMSGFTTTGASILSDIEAMPRGILFWRATTHWIGGMGILLLSIAILPLLGVGGMQLFNAEVSHVTVEKLTPRISQTARLLWFFYLALTVILIAVYFADGMPLFDAIAHSFATVASGGFSTKNASMAHYPSMLTQYVTIAGMFLAGASFTLHVRAARGKSLKPYGRDNEFVAYSVIVIVASILVFFGIPHDMHAGLEGRARAALFQVVSLVSSTGYITSDYGLWSPAAQMVLLMMMIPGGCAGSTAGGMKIMRVILLLKSWKNEIRKLVHPRGIFVVRLNGNAVAPDIISAVQGFLIAYVSLFALCTVALTALGLDPLSAASAVISSMSNIGPGLGSVGAVENFGHVAGAGKWILSLCMLMGRLELFTILVLFSPSLWKK